MYSQEIKKVSHWLSEDRTSFQQIQQMRSYQTEQMINCTPQNLHRYQQNDLEAKMDTLGIYVQLQGGNHVGHSRYSIKLQPRNSILETGEWRWKDKWTSLISKRPVASLTSVEGWQLQTLGGKDVQGWGWEWPGSPVFAFVFFASINVHT